MSYNFPHNTPFPFKAPDFTDEVLTHAAAVSLSLKKVIDRCSALVFCSRLKIHARLPLDLVLG
jgi:hypothetical protein